MISKKETLKNDLQRDVKNHFAKYNYELYTISFKNTDRNLFAQINLSSCKPDKLLTFLKKCGYFSLSKPKIEYSRDYASECKISFILWSVETRCDYKIAKYMSKNPSIAFSIRSFFLILAIFTCIYFIFLI